MNLVTKEQAIALAKSEFWKGMTHNTPFANLAQMARALDL